MGWKNRYQLSGSVIIINGDGGCRLWQPVQAVSQLKSSGLVLGRRPLGTILYLSNELGELSQWLCHDDSTINIVLELLLSLLYYCCACLPGRVTVWGHHFRPVSRCWAATAGLRRLPWRSQSLHCQASSSGCAVVYWENHAGLVILPYSILVSFA